MKDQIKNSAKILAPVGTLGGFIGDVLTPLGPVTEWLFYLSIFITLAFGLVYLKNKSEFSKKILPTSFLLVLTFGIFSVINNDTENGILGDNSEMIAGIQKSLFNIEESLEKIDQKLDVRFDKIEELITSSNPIENPKNANDFILNAYLYKNSGNLVKSEKSFHEFIKITGMEKFDLFLDYFEVLKTNYGRQKAISVLKSSSSSTMVNVIDIIENNAGKKVYNTIEKIDSIDKDFKKWLQIYSYFNYYMQDYSGGFADACSSVENSMKADMMIKFYEELDENYNKVQQFFMNKEKPNEGINFNSIYLLANVPHSTMKTMKSNWDKFPELQDQYENNFKTYFFKIYLKPQFQNCSTLGPEEYWHLANNPPKDPNTFWKK